MCYEALQIRGFRNIQQNRVIFCLAADLDQPEGSMSIEGCRRQHPEEIGLADVVRAGAGDEDSSGAKHLEGSKVEFLVSADGRIKIPLSLGERRRIENDGVVEAMGGRVV